MVTITRARKQPKFKSLMVKYDCYLRIKNEAENKGSTITGYLEELTLQAMNGKPVALLPKTPHEQICERLDRIEGNMVFSDFLTGEDGVDHGLIRMVLKENPEATRAGFCDLVGGKWQFNKQRFEEFQNSDQVKRFNEERAKHMWRPGDWPEKEVGE